MNAPTKIVLGKVPGKPVRFSYLNVFTPRLNAQNQKQEYSVSLLVPKTNTEDVALIKAAIKAAIDKEFTANGKKPGPQAWNPLRDGDKDTKQDGSPLGAEAKGCYVVSAKMDADRGKPGVVDAQMQPVLDPKGVVSGDWGLASINFYGYSKGTGGVGAGLHNIMKVKDGEPLGSQSRPEDDFAGVEADFLS